MVLKCHSAVEPSLYDEVQVVCFKAGTVSCPGLLVVLVCHTAVEPSPYDEVHMVCLKQEL